MPSGVTTATSALPPSSIDPSRFSFRSLEYLSRRDPPERVAVFYGFSVIIRNKPDILICQPLPFLLDIFGLFGPKNRLNFPFFDIIQKPELYFFYIIYGFGVSVFFSEQSFFPVCQYGNCRKPVFISHFLSPPVLLVYRPISDRFFQMLLPDSLTPVQIGDRPCHLQYLMIGPRRESESSKCLTHQ